MNKKILILYTSVGLGHKSIAENLGFALQKAGFIIRLKDILKVQAKESSKLIKYFQKFYLFCNEKFPHFWAWIYNSANKGVLAFLTLPFRVPLAGRNYHQALSLIKEFQPDLILSTNNIPSAVVSYLIKDNLYSGKFAIAFSDFHLHRYWIHKGCDLYLVNTEEQKQEMLGLGIEENKIVVCGITLKPKVDVNLLAVKEKFGIGQGQKVILVGAGSLGIGLHLDTLDELVSINNAKIIIVCGNNQILFEDLRKKFEKNLNVKVLGFYTPMDELYAITNIFITKPGGLTTAEALRWNLPLVVTHFLPGGEQLNIEYLQKRALIISKPANLKFLVEEELKTANLRKKLTGSLEVKTLVQEGQGAVDAIFSLLHSV